MQNTQLSPRGAVLVGSFAILCGVFPILIGLGVLTPTPPDGPPTPGWVAVAAGLMFVFAGVAIVLDYGVAGGVGPDGDLKPGTPLVIRGANLLLGMGIVGLMTAVAGWVAFGTGPRRFSSTVSLPFYSSHNPASSELTGRVVFGAGAVLMAAMFVACGVVGVRRFVRAWRQVAPSRRP
jgi:hypothetical protein